MHIRTNFLSGGARMPIKFRCQHCDQFLGIAQSRAGADVDCPRCGRKLRVPGSQPAEAAHGVHSHGKRSEDTLYSALSELSALADPRYSNERYRHSSVSAEAKADSNAAVMAAPARASVPQTAVAVSTEIVAEEVSTPAEAVSVQQTFSNDRPDEQPIQDHSPENEYLHELAGLADSAGEGELSPELLDEMRSISRGSGHIFATLVGGACLVVAGVVAGWYAARSGVADTLSTLNVEEERPRQRNLEDLDLTTVSSNSVETIVSGVVHFEGEFGEPLADAQSLVLILPVEHPGTLVLSSRSVLNDETHPDFKATAAALATLGGRIMRTSETGEFTTSLNRDSRFIAVAISQNLSRPTDVPISGDIDRLLKTWFDAPSRMIGRRTVTAVPVDGQVSELTLTVRR